MEKNIMGWLNLSMYGKFWKDLLGIGYEPKKPKETKPEPELKPEPEVAKVESKPKPEPKPKVKKVAKPKATSKPKTKAKTAVQAKPSPDPMITMTKAQLLEHGQERGIELKKTMKKEDMIAALNS